MNLLSSELGLKVLLKQRLVIFFEELERAQKKVNFGLTVNIL